MANVEQWYSLQKFVDHNEANLKRYRAEKYPWMVRHITSIATDPRTDALLDEHVSSRLEAYGFRIEARKATPTKWQCRSDILGTPLRIYFDKGTYRPSLNMTGYIELPSFGYLTGLAEPFFFSRADFRISEGDQIDVQLGRFFGRFEQVFPDLINALEQSVLSGKQFSRDVEQE